MKILPTLTLALLLCTTTVMYGWDGVIVHHTDSEHMTLEECNEWHNARGWDGCGYSFIIQKDGTVETARGFERTGAHCRGFNKRFLGIAFVGKGTANDRQLKAFRQFLVDNKSKVGTIVRGHKEMGRTECPGKIMEQLKESQ